MAETAIQYAQGLVNLFDVDSRVVNRVVAVEPLHTRVYFTDGTSTPINGSWALEINNRLRAEAAALLFNDVPLCPFCGQRHEDWWDELKLQVGDGSEWGTTCSECGGEFTVIACVMTSFSTTAGFKT